ncbi:hypothetical protein [Streptomyces pinistramenti]|uniref:hypothetical protein n=1 Tax=Streptomyces pinistramenti TaxID=2884812 RepID=UPI001D097987|nr:hypothetical protein [Streptomyces pinistramenti]MCB5910036.1 hypothetical protein [Streptomyces pinistramenti]
MPKGRTVPRANSPRLRPDVTGPEHLAIQDALDTLVEILGEHPHTEDEPDEIPPFDLCGAPYDGTPAVRARCRPDTGTTSTGPRTARSCP